MRNYLILFTCFVIFELSAWQRTALSDCQRTYKACRRSENQCQKENQRCIENASATDLATFQFALTPHVKTIFAQLSDDRKKQAMDLADNNQMTPNDAVAKVAGSVVCPPSTK